MCLFLILIQQALMKLVSKRRTSVSNIHVVLYKLPSFKLNFSLEILNSSFSFVLILPYVFRQLFVRQRENSHMLRGKL